MLPVSTTASQNGVWFTQEQVAKHSFRVQHSELRAFHRYGKVIVIVGTSTAGKTSLISAFKQLRPCAVENGMDQIYVNMALRSFKEQFPIEFEVLKNSLIDDMSIFCAIFLQRYKVKSLPVENAAAKIGRESTFLRLNYEVVREQVETELFKEAFTQAVIGNTTLFDILKIDRLKSYIHSGLYRGPIVFCVAYCPFRALFERLSMRNQKALENKDDGELRLNTSPLMQYSELFTNRTNASEPLIERLERATVVEALDRQFDVEIVERERVAASGFKGFWDASSNDPSEDGVDPLEKERATKKETLLQALGFKTSDSSVALTVKPDLQDAFLLNTADRSPQQLAFTLLRHVKV